MFDFSREAYPGTAAGMMKHFSICLIMLASSICPFLFSSCKEGTPASEENEEYVPSAADTVSSVLIVTDVQRDFFDPEGSLYVKGGELLPKKITAVIDSYDAVIFTLDWHPGNHCSFKENGGIWPPHCVNFTQGAGLPDEFTPFLKKGNEKVRLYFKATKPDKEQYGAFDEVNGQIASWFKTAEKIAICGIAGDYCVKETAANILKFVPSEKFVILTDLIANIDDGTTLKKFIEDNSVRTE